MFIYAPKNSGLFPKVRPYIEELTLPLKKRRGSDIPFWVENTPESMGITGDDLFQEYRIRKPETSLAKLLNIPWEDEEALFGSPTLCFISNGNPCRQTIPVVAIPSKYQATCMCWLDSRFGSAGYKTRVLEGGIEYVLSQGISDYAIDIVYTGSTISDLGLSIKEKINGGSDLVLIGETQVNCRKGGDTS